MEKYFQSEHVMNFLMGLNESFSQIRGQILLQDPFPQINKVFSLVVQEERQRSIVQSNHSSSVGNQPVAFAVKIGLKQNQYSSNSNRFPIQERPFCTHCQMQGHLKEKCYKLHGYSIVYKPIHRVNNVVIADDPTHGEDLNSVVKGLSSMQCQLLLYVLSSHLATEANRGNDDTQKGIPGTYYSFSSITKCVSSKTWIRDSGSSCHICHDLNKFTNIRTVKNFTVTFPTNGKVRSLCR